MRQEKYDLIIDGQGLLKSAVIGLFAKGSKAGFDRRSVRESFASWFYQRTIFVPKDQHAITRLRTLFASVLQYQYDASTLSYGISTKKQFRSFSDLPEEYCLFIPNTSWLTKQWPVKYWRELLGHFSAKKMPVVLPGGYQHELPLVQKIVAGIEYTTILPQASLTQLRNVIANATAVVSVDTGLAHIAAALNKPTVVLYGPTDPKKIGTLGQDQIHLQAQFFCAPCGQKKCTYISQDTEDDSLEPACFRSITPKKVWETLQPWLNKNG